MRGLGAVGDVCFRYFDTNGKAVKSTLDQRLIGITPAKLAKFRAGSESPAVTANSPRSAVLCAANGSTS